MTPAVVPSFVLDEAEPFVEGQSRGVDIGPAAPTAALYAHLARERILTRAITGISENGLLRITIGPPAQRTVVLDALRSYPM
ncbi:hypothetical protein [Nocardia jinanensis]|uniref:hypothetical protein n=1 Tax=Nocardia jinanensis TaxID=382504 RepID=UPI0007A4A7EF|nr:hypothetical protein [Nocardia jinanensis]